MDIPHLITKTTLPISALLSGSAVASLNMHDASQNSGIPADYAQFQSILSESKLQISEPHGKKGNQIQVAEDSNFAGIVNQYFYVDKETENFVFKMFGDHRHAELRVHENFKIDDPNTFHRLTAKFEPVNPELPMKESQITQNEITYLQAHSKGIKADGTDGIPHPLLRVVWKQDAKGVKGHYWAIIKDNALICKGDRSSQNISKPACAPENAYKHYDLGKAVVGQQVEFDIIMGNNTLAINVDVNSKLATTLLTGATC